jgi:glycosyltransferase involved in cell wall biosynthesis
MSELFRRRILVIAPGRRGRGGIDSVVRLHDRTALWRNNCVLLSTFDDRGTARKIWAAIRAYVAAPLAIARARLVHIHLAGETSLLRKLPFIALAAACNRPVILHVHALGEESLFTKTPRWAWRFVFGRASRVIALSSAWSAIIRQHTGHSGVVVIPNPVRQFFPAERSAEGTQRVLYVGKLEPRKGFDTLIAAAAIALRTCPTLEFWFAGHGNIAEAQALASQYGISKHVCFFGWLSAQQVEHIYQDAHIFCLPSFNEGVPMAMLEAMSHGLPVICTPVGGIPDVVSHGVNGLLVTPGDTEGIAASIVQLIQQPALATSLAACGRSTVNSLCALELVSEQLEALYQDVGADTVHIAQGALRDA